LLATYPRIPEKKSVFFLLSIDMPSKIYAGWSSPYENEPAQNRELFIAEPTTNGKNEITFRRF